MDPRTHALQKLVELAVGPRVEARAGRKLSEAAVEGYRYGGCIRPIDPGTGGDMFVRQEGTYVTRCMVWLDPAERPSLFHTWQLFAGNLARSKGQRDVASLATLLAHENRQGFLLRQVLPLDGFVKNPEKWDAGTACFFALFERPGESSAPLVLDAATMKDERPADGDSVACPVLGCDTVGSGTGHGAHLCPRHRIFISPSTFEYENADTSLLWTDADSLAAVAKLRSGAARGRRTWARMGRERDEDSLTWNVFRYLERNDFLHRVLEPLVPRLAWRDPRISKPETVVYWSVDLATGGVSADLEAARVAVGESATSGTEPDLIVITPQRIFLIESKLCAEAKTEPSTALPTCLDYVKAADLFTKDLPSTVAEIGDELMRHFVLGHALSKRLDRPFTTVLVTRPGADPLTPAVTSAVRLSPSVGFSHIGWDTLLGDIHALKPSSLVDQALLTRYLAEKTLGYEHGTLQLLFPPAPVTPKP